MLLNVLYSLSISVERTSMIEMSFVVVCKVHHYRSVFYEETVTPDTQELKMKFDYIGCYLTDKCLIYRNYELRITNMFTHLNTFGFV